MVTERGDRSSPKVTTFPRAIVTTEAAGTSRAPAGGILLEHRYAAAGRYVAKVTAISTGCDSTPQTVPDDKPISVGNAPPE